MPEPGATIDTERDPLSGEQAPPEDASEPQLETAEAAQAPTAADADGHQPATEAAAAETADETAEIPEPSTAETAEGEAKATEEVSAAEVEATAAGPAAEAAEAAEEAPTAEVEAATEAPTAEVTQAAEEAPAPEAEAAADAPPQEEAPATDEPPPEGVEAAEEAPAPEPVAEAAAGEATADEAPAAEEAGGEETGEETVKEAKAADDEKPKKAKKAKPRRLSKREREVVEKLDGAREAKQPVEGKVIGWNKGGYHVVIDGLAAFCPVSQIEVGNPRSPKQYLDKSFPFLVIEIQRGGRRVVVSRSEAIKIERETRAAEARERFKPGTVVDGTITSLTDFGAFVDLGGGIEGLVHVSEISRQRLEHPKELLEVGQPAKVVVLKLQNKGERISLSMKRLEADPWKTIDQRYKPGDKLQGVIRRKADFGLFVEVEPGVEGLVHTSRLPFGTDLSDESLEEGREVELWVQDCDPKRRRLSLSMREISSSDPWSDVGSRYDVGKVLQGKVERLARFGAFIELEPGLTGLLPFSAVQQSPTANLRRQYHPGKEVTVQVMSIDASKRRISLGTEGSKAEGSQADYRDYVDRQAKKDSGLNTLAAAFAKLKGGDA